MVLSQRSKPSTNTRGGVDPSPDVVTTEEFARRLDVSTATLLRWEAAGIVPPARRLTTNSVMWIRKTVDDWFAAGMPKVKKERKIRNGKAKRKR